MKQELGKLPSFSKANLSQFRSFLFPGIIVILIVVSAVTILKPKLDDFLDLRRGLAKQKKELAQLSQKVAVLGGYDQNELKTRVNQVLKVLPIEKEGPFALATVRGLVSENDLELGNLEVEIGKVSTESAEVKSKKEETLPSLGIQLSVFGSLADLYNFLESVEAKAPIMRVQQVNIDREGTTIDTQIVLSTYYLVVPKEIGKVNRQVVPISAEEEKIYQELSDYQTVGDVAALPYISSGKENPFTY